LFSAVDQRDAVRAVFDERTEAVFALPQRLVGRREFRGTLLERATPVCRARHAATSAAAAASVTSRAVPYMKFALGIERHESTR
jgi:hypothetical protein